MPIPKPESGEQENDFISRCVRQIIDEYDRDQALGICYSQYRRKEEMKKQEEIFILQPRKAENRGMYLSRCSNNGRMKKQYPNIKERMGFCLNTFNEYYSYWSKLDFAEVPKNTALGDCITKEKSKGLNYREAYARCATKVGTPPLGAGQSINLEEDLLVEPVVFEELNVYGYPTEYFYMCPGATATFQHLIEMGGDEDTKRMVRNAAMIADKLFDLEEDVMEEEMVSEEDVALAELLVKDFYDLMKVIDDKIGMSHDVSYMDGHIEKIKSYL